MAEKTWLIEYLEKTGQTNIATLYQNSPDKKPDELDIDQAATDLRSNMFSVLKSSDEFKESIKGNSITIQKKINKQFNEDWELGLTNSEAEKKEYSELVQMAKEKVNEKVEGSKNGHTKEWQDKYAKIESEFSGFKKKYETDTTDLKKQVETEATRFKQMEIQAKKDSIFNDFFEKQSWGKDVDQAHKDNAKIILKSVIQDRKINWNENGEAFTGESDPVIDGMTPLKTLGDVFKSIGTERKLFQQANPGAGQPNGNDPKFTPSGDPIKDTILQDTFAHVADLNAGNF